MMKPLEKSLRFNGYSEKLCDFRWHDKRRKILDRDGYMCQNCSITNTELHIHHCYYESGKEPWEYDNQSLVTLCRNCHEYETEYLYSMKKNLTDSLSKKGVTANTFEQLAFAFECAALWPRDKSAWAALSWAIRTPEIIKSIVSFYNDSQMRKAV